MNDDELKKFLNDCFSKLTPEQAKVLVELDPGIKAFMELIAVSMANSCKELSLSRLVILHAAIAQARNHVARCIAIINKINHSPNLTKEAKQSALAVHLQMAETVKNKEMHQEFNSLMELLKITSKPLDEGEDEGEQEPPPKPRFKID